jgi:quinoprotein glucose dehydrogenase
MVRAYVTAAAGVRGGTMKICAPIPHRVNDNAMNRRSLSRLGRLSSYLAVLPILVTLAHAQDDAKSGWPSYSGPPGGERYSPLSQINRETVSRLKVAWTYRTGAVDVKTDLAKDAAFEATPILAAGKLFLTTPYNQVIALDPATGAKLWDFDPRIDLTRDT